MFWFVHRFLLHTVYFTSFYHAYFTKMDFPTFFDYFKYYFKQYVLWIFFYFF